MKPPPRKRTRPSKELPECPPRGKAVCRWPLKDMKKLLTALTKLNKEEPLDPERVREHLPSRTAAEINLFLEALKEKVIVFAKRKEYAERREERRPRKPLEMWIQEASAVSAGVEETLSSAFNQMLTVTSVEPCAPPQPQSPAQPLSKAPNTSPLVSSSPSVGKTPPAQSPPVTEDQQKTSQPHPAPSTPGTPPTARRTPLPSKMTEVSFEKIYHYISTLHKPSEQRKLTPMESAIVLDLLMSLPEELLLVDCDPLRQHLSQVYLNIPSHDDSRRTKGFSKKRKDPPGQPHPAPEDSSSTQRSPQPPLNPFRIPLSLISRKTPTNPT